MHYANMSGNVEAILFDAVGTLLRPQPSVAEAYRAAGLRYGTQLSLVDVAASFATSNRPSAATGRLPISASSMVS